MLDRSSERRHLCFVPNLGGNAFNLSILSMMLVVEFFIAVLYQVEKVLFYSGLLRDCVMIRS